MKKAMFKAARQAARPECSGVRLSVLSTALALALGWVSLPAEALTLGRLQVQSSLGEPLRGQIPVSDVTPAEAQGLRVQIASPAAFSAAGVGLSPALSDLRVALERAPGGRYVVRLTGGRPVNEPFIDLLLEASWNSGRIVRDYTVLLDPPGHSQRMAAAPVAPQIEAAPAPRTRAASRPVPAVAAAPVRPPAPRAAADSAVRTGSGESRQVTVQKGDTASRIAGAYKPADISLDQMLVALLRANPDAFIGGNVNRMKAGALLDIPGADQAGAVAPEQAKRTVHAQSRDFNAYRHRLASNAPSATVATADREAGGKLQANVQDRAAGASSPDKLTVSPGEASAAAADQKAAAARQAEADAARAAELKKNLSDLNKLQAASGSAAAAAPSATPPAPQVPAAAAPAAAPAVAAPAAGSAPVQAPVAVLPDVASPGAAAAPAGGNAATPAAGPAVAASTPAAVAPTPPKAKPAPAPEPSFLESISNNNPILLGAGALLLALLALLGYRRWSQRREDAADSLFVESRLPRESFFGASHGESVDTKDRNSSMVSSLSYSPSQLDAGDVDPVAEADVYLAYGRDLQAEEILREALRTSPQRTAIHLKLLEIYAKRRDLRAFEALATEMHGLTGGAGADWSRAIDMGRDLDPGNPLYQAGQQAAQRADPKPATIEAQHLAATDEPPPRFVPSVAPLDFDLDSRPADAQSAHDASPSPLADLPAAAMPAKTAAAAPALGATLATAAAAGLGAAKAATATKNDNTPIAPDLDFNATRREASPQTGAFDVTQRSALVESTFDRTERAALDDGGFDRTERAPLDVGGFETTERAPLNGLNPELDSDLDTTPGTLDAPPRHGGADFEDRTQPATLRAGLPGDSGFIEFDMSTLSKPGSLDTAPGTLETLDGAAAENPHAVKLSLARELRALGDDEGAISLVEEVAAESSGEVKAEAARLLAELR